jgi:hypothetical protein
LRKNLTTNKKYFTLKKSSEKKVGQKPGQKVGQKVGQRKNRGKEKVPKLL